MVVVVKKVINCTEAASAKGALYKKVFWKNLQNPQENTSAIVFF